VTAAPEIWFYHLQGTTLEQALPSLLEKSLARGWRAVVRVGSQERLKVLDDHLWTYRDESFLPHGAVDEGDPATQPIFLTLADERPNAAEIGFSVDGADLLGTPGFERVVLMFDGNDDDGLARARDRWKTLKAAGANLSYWRQDDAGRWGRQA
jgi:DNA polymerase-3 subunit chi